LLYVICRGLESPKTWKKTGLNAIKTGLNAIKTGLNAIKTGF